MGDKIKQAAMELQPFIAVCAATTVFVQGYKYTECLGPQIHLHH